MKFLNSKTYYIFLFIITLLQSPAHIFAGGSAHSEAEKQFNYASFIGLTMLQSTTHIFACVSAASDAERLELQGLEKLKKGKSQDALQLFIRAGKLGNPRAYCMAGVMYDSSNVAGVSRNDVLALKYYKLALKIDSNCGPALHGIGAFTYHGRGGIEKNREEAIRLWKLGADVNDVGCFYDLGVCEMEEGRTGHAIFWFRKSALSHNGAACNLGSLLMDGFGPGITLDSVMEGLLWLIKSAKSGNKTAIAKVKKYSRPTREQMQDSLVMDIVNIQSGKYDNLDSVAEYILPQAFTVTIPKQASEKVCAVVNCKKSENLKPCSRCNSIYYCSRECQVADWPRHREKDCRPRLEGQQENDSRPRLEGPKVEQKTELQFCSGVNCKKSENLKPCSRCNSIYYCSRECQVTDWPRHREKDCRPRLEGPQ